MKGEGDKKIIGGEETELPREDYNKNSLQFLTSAKSVDTQRDHSGGD